MRALKDRLDARISVKSFVILPCSAVRICPTLPSSVITLQEVDYLPRLCKSMTKLSKLAQKIDDETVDLVADFIEQSSGGLSMDEHIANCQRFELQKKAARSAQPVGDMAPLLTAPRTTNLAGG